jgi:hypothetical protein
VTVAVALALTVIGLAILYMAVYAEMKNAEQEVEAWRQRFFFGIEPEDPDSPISEDDFWGDTLERLPSEPGPVDMASTGPPPADRDSHASGVEPQAQYRPRNSRCQRFAHGSVGQSCCHGPVERSTLADL